MRWSPRFTDSSLRQPPAVSKAVRGVPAAAVWALLAPSTEHLPAYEAQGLERADRQRARGGGRDCEQPPAGDRGGGGLDLCTLAPRASSAGPTLRGDPVRGGARVAPPAARAPGRAAVPG